MTTTISGLSATLEQRRKSVGLSFLDLTRQSGVSRQAIYRLFHGQDVQLSTLLAVCRVLETDLLTAPRSVSAHVASTGILHSNPYSTAATQTSHVPSAQEARMQRLRPVSDPEGGV